jgi:hypothetical protein
MAKYIIRKERATGMNLRDLFSFKKDRPYFDEEYAGGKMCGGLSGYYGNDRESLATGGANLVTKNLFGLGSAWRRHSRTPSPTDYHNSPFFETNRAPHVQSGVSDSPQTEVALSGLGSSHCGSWYGNEPEAKIAGGVNLQTKNLFGLGNVENETIEYLGAGFSQNSMVGIGLGIAALYYLTK